MSAGHIPKELADFYELTQTRAAKLWEKQGRRCHWCSCDTILTRHEVPNKATEDHVIPRGRGGSDLEENVVSACLKCNARRNKEDSTGLRDGTLLAKRWTRPFVAVSGRDLELESMQRELRIARWRYEQERRRVLEMERTTFGEWIRLWLYQKVRQHLRVSGSKGKYKESA
jgi:hypothetical protein